MSFRQPLTHRATIGRFIVQELRIFGRAPALRDGADDNQPVVGADAHSQLIADLQLLRRLCARPVYLHLAAGDRRR